MSWKSGSEIAWHIMKKVSPRLDKKSKLMVLEAICDSFEDADCDTLYELSEFRDRAVKEYIRQRYPIEDE